MHTTILKRDCRTESFDAEKLLISLRFVIKALKLKDNPISQKVYTQAMAKLHQANQNSTIVTSEQIREAVVMVLLENNLQTIADFYIAHRDKKLPLSARK